MKSAQRGFTIVELIIVISIIGILAAISVVAYNGSQARSQDASVRAAAKQFENALVTWGSENGQVMTGGSGSTKSLADSGGSMCADGQNGYFGKTVYLCTVEDVLIAAGLLPVGFSSKIPSNPVAYTTSANPGRYTFMFYKCGSDAGQYVLYMALRSPTTQDANDLSAAFVTCGVSTTVAPTQSTFRNTNGMRSARVIQL